MPRSVEPDQDETLVWIVDDGLELLQNAQAEIPEAGGKDPGEVPKDVIEGGVGVGMRRRMNRRVVEVGDLEGTDPQVHMDLIPAVWPIARMIRDAIGVGNGVDAAGGARLQVGAVQVDIGIPEIDDHIPAPSVDVDGNNHLSFLGLRFVGLHIEGDDGDHVWQVGNA